MGALLLVAGGCSGASDDTIVLASLGLELQKPQGFVRVVDAETGDTKNGGVVLRLALQQSVSGSPRVDVTLAPVQKDVDKLDDFVSKNLAEIDDLVRAGTIRVESVERVETHVGPRRAMRIRHVYLFPTAGMSITQVSVLFVLDGRGVAITAAGRTELYTPHAARIDAMLSSVRVNEATAPAAQPLTTPIDLGADSR